MPALAVIGALVWLTRYASRFGLHLRSPAQWAQHFDQTHYLTSAQAFAHGNLSAASHWYPLAYPLMASPFVWLVPNEPFFLPNLFLFTATLILFARTMKRLGLGAPSATLLFLLGDMVIARIAKLWIVPWATSLSVPIIWALIEQTLTILDEPADRQPPTIRSMLMLGVVAGALPLARPTDGVPGLIAVLFALAGLRRQRRLRSAHIGWLGLGALAVCVPYGLLHIAIYGPRTSDYALAAAKQGAAFDDLPWKAYVVVITAAPWFPASPSIVEAMPWVIPGVAGLGLTWVFGDGRQRRALTLIACLALPYGLIFLAYTDLQPPGLWTFSNAHYFKWLFPLFAVGTWLWIRQFRNRTGARRAIVALVITVLPAMIRPMPIAVPVSHPARMLMFHGATNRVWDSAYFSPAMITDAQGRLNNIGRFHQVPDAYGERAIAVWRLFSGPAVRTDPGEPVPSLNPQKPYARYAVRLSFGVPCWVSTLRGCQMPPPPSM